jgi:hypothetical protein
MIYYNILSLTDYFMETNPTFILNFNFNHTEINLYQYNSMLIKNILH